MDKNAGKTPDRVAPSEAANTQNVRAGGPHPAYLHRKTLARAPRGYQKKCRALARFTKARQRPQRSGKLSESQGRGVILTIKPKTLARASRG